MRYLHLKLPLEGSAPNNGKQSGSCVIATNALLRSRKYWSFMVIKLNFSLNNILSSPGIFVNINSVLFGFVGFFKIFFFFLKAG